MFFLVLKVETCPDLFAISYRFQEQIGIMSKRRRHFLIDLHLIIEGMDVHFQGLDDLAF